MKTTKLHQLTYIASGVTLLVILSQMTISLGPVPFTLQTFAVGLIATIYPWRLACSSVGLYLLLGGIGIPVFSGFSGGIASLTLHPTAGFLWGFLTYAFVTSLMTYRDSSVIRVLSANILGDITCFLLGIFFFRFSLDTSWSKTLALTTLPFLLPELGKISLVCLSHRYLQPILKKNR
ncbi:biotin transporter BioY [Streptococcus gallolyticus]|nr:biotin transporter BioY [Streptococcus gallolyticus]MBY5040403.1 biotin transporter BioY [Streptococcus gallolyticus]